MYDALYYIRRAKFPLDPYLERTELMLGDNVPC